MASQAWNNERVFQSTHPREGVRLLHLRFAELRALFQSTHPREGVRQAEARKAAAEMEFQSTHPREGVRRIPLVKNDFIEYFNPGVRLSSH